MTELKQLLSSLFVYTITTLIWLMFSPLFKCRGRPCVAVYRAAYCTNARGQRHVPGGVPGGSDDKESACNAGDAKVLWRRKWQPTPVFLPGKSHGQGSLVVYHPLGSKESDITEWLTHTQTHLEQPQTVPNHQELILGTSIFSKVPVCQEPVYDRVFWINYYAEHNLHQKISNTNMVTRSLDSITETCLW